MGGVGSGQRDLFGPRFSQPQREFVRKRLEKAGWVRKLLNVDVLSSQFGAEFGETRPVESFLRLLKRLADKHAREVERLRTREPKERAEPRPQEASKQKPRSYEGPTRFSPEEEQAIVSFAPDCVIVEHIVDYDAITRKLDEMFPGRRGKWNRDGIRAILKRHGVYDRLLQGERPMPIVVRPPSDPVEHHKLLRGLLVERMGKLNAELAKLREAHVRATRAIEAAEAPVDGVGRDRDAGLVLALHPDDQTQIVLSGGVVANLVASPIGQGPGEPTDEDETPFASDDVPFA